MTAHETLDELRPLRFSIAYRMLSSVSEAEDVVQEASLRYHRARSGGRRIESPEAFAAAIVTRLAIDELRSARVRRERYVGAWLPEPLVTDRAPRDPAALAEQADSLSMAFLVLLERLSPLERAAFVLHDVFDYGYDEIAAIVERSEAACRQHVSRARRHVRAGRPRFDASPEERERLAERFFAAVDAGDLGGLIEMLAEDVVVHGDGGGVGPSWAGPIRGRDRVGRLMIGLGARIREHGLRLERHEINGQPGALTVDAEGRVLNVFALDVVDGRVRTVRSVINPDKLRHLGPVVDVWALLGRDRTEPRA
jgi:RNA polymerase sigma-70 factor (ECF subfamily)